MEDLEVRVRSLRARPQSTRERMRDANERTRTTKKRAEERRKRVTGPAARESESGSGKKASTPVTPAPPPKGVPLFPQSHPTGAISREHVLGRYELIPGWGAASWCEVLKECPWMPSAFISGVGAGTCEGLLAKLVIASTTSATPTFTTSTEPQRGARFLSSGSFGCVYFPSVPCTRDTPAEVLRAPHLFVSKLFGNRASADDEWRQSMMVNTIDPAQDFSTRFVARCEADMSLVEKGELDKCSIRGSIFGRAWKEQIISTYGGETLKSVSDKGLVVQGFESIVKTGLVRLAQAGMVHLDIKPDNILLFMPLSSERPRCLLIDFGLAKPMAALYSMDSMVRLALRYEYYPSEFAMFAELVDLGRVRFLVSAPRYAYFSRLFSMTDMSEPFLRQVMGVCAANKADVFAAGVTLSKSMGVVSGAPETHEKLGLLASAMINQDVVRRPCPAACAWLWPGAFDVGVTLPQFRTAIKAVQDHEYRVTNQVLQEVFGAPSLDAVP